MKTNSILMLGRWSFVMVVIGLFSIPANATDLTLFGGMQHAGDLTVETAQSGATNLVQNFDPKTFWSVRRSTRPREGDRRRIHGGICAEFRQ